MAKLKRRRNGIEKYCRQTAHNPWSGVSVITPAELSSRTKRSGVKDLHLLFKGNFRLGDNTFVTLSFLSGAACFLMRGEDSVK
jgi:hypothetical protein